MMRGYNDAYDPRNYYNMPNGYVAAAYLHSPPLNILPVAALPHYSDYTPSRYASSVDMPVGNSPPYSANGCLPSISIPENIPLMAPPGTSDGSEQRPLKRKPAGERRDPFEKRPRQAMLSESPRRSFSTQGHVRTYSKPQHGIQHNPVEMVWSPRRESKSTPRKRMKMSTISALPQDLRNAALLVEKLDPNQKHIRYYAVPGGKVPGIYTNYDRVFKQIKDHSGCLQKKFPTLDEAWDFMNANRHLVERSLQCQKERTGMSYRPSSAYNAHAAQRIPPPPPPPMHTSSPPSPAYDAHTAQRIPPPPSLHTALPSPPPNRSHGSANYDVSSCKARHVVERSQFAVDFLEPNTNPSNYDAEPEIKLSAEQQRVVDLIVDGGRNVFYTGSAGCGKSTILKAFVPLLRKKGKRVRIVAPTNLAALNVGGQTISNYAGWTPDDMQKPLDMLKMDAHGKDIWKRFNTTDVLVIDEISMVENLLFERLNEVMKDSRAGKATGPFGGVQVVVTGDFCQLSPVKPFGRCIGCGQELTIKGRKHECQNRKCHYDFWLDTDKWAFRSRAWQECKFEQINLTEIHRQDDRKFISILQKIRIDGVIVENHKNILLHHSKETDGAIQIHSTNKEADKINYDTIENLPSKGSTWKCLDDFQWNGYDEKLLKTHTEREHDGTLKALTGHRYEATMKLKENMRVLLRANLEPNAGLVNGSQGSIVGFEPFDRKNLPRAAERKGDRGDLRGPHAHFAQGQIKEYAKLNGRQPWPIVQFDNGLRRTIYADCLCNEVGIVSEHGGEFQLSLLSRTQIPLAAGYAITVHKSQGMTLDRVVVDLSRAFEASQMYVALSRARSLKGLEVVALPRKYLGGANPQVREFFNTYLNPRSPHSATQAPQSS